MYGVWKTLKGDEKKSIRYFIIKNIRSLVELKNMR